MLNGNDSFWELILPDYVLSHLFYTDPISPPITFFDVLRPSNYDAKTAY